jgi:hypothetical protein
MIIARLFADSKSRRTAGTMGGLLTIMAVCATLWRTLNRQAGNAVEACYLARVRGMFLRSGGEVNAGRTLRRLRA